METPSVGQDGRTIEETSARVDEGDRAEHDGLALPGETAGQSGPESGPEQSGDGARRALSLHELLQAEPEELGKEHDVRAGLPGFLDLRGDAVDEGLGVGRAGADVEGAEVDLQSCHVRVQKVRVLGDSCVSPNSFQGKTALSSGRRT